MNKPPINAFDSEYYIKVGEMFDSIGERDDIYVIIFTAAGKLFSAGNDVAEFSKFGSVESMRSVVDCVQKCMGSIYGCKKPVICAVQGAAAGAGLAAMGCCDIVVAAETASFLLPEIRVGIIGASGFLKGLLPDKIARYYAYTGKNIPIAEMLQHGAINRVVPLDRLMDTAMEIAQELLENAPGALSDLKRAMNFNDNARYYEKYEVEMGYMEAFIFTEDFRESVNAFLERRKPVYKNK